MSGDVQPRKRREKKKKKEDAPEESAFQHQHHHVPVSPVIADDLNIHIQKEASTGGGLCAKLVFFILLSILTTLIGLIITEHRGLTDLDAIDRESRFAQVFDGWIDKSPISLESPEQLSIEESEENFYEEEEDDHEESPEAEDEEVDTNEDDDDDDEEEEENEEEIDEDEDDEEQDDEEEDTVEETAENESGELSNETATDEEDQEDDDEQDKDDEDDEEDNLSEEKDKYLSEEKDKYLSEEKEVSEEDEQSESLVTKEEYESEEDEDEDQDEAEEEKSPESKYEKDDTDETEEKVNLHKRKKVVDLTESEEAVSLGSVDEETAEKSDDTIEEDEDASKEVDEARDSETEKSDMEDDASDTTNKPDETENSNMVVKFGVGTALLVVAHVVLIQKWRTGTELPAVGAADKKPQSDDSEEKESVTPDLSRRNTIVSPPSLEEIEQDIENVEEEYSENEDGYSSEEENRSKPTRAKMRYQELQSTYSHSLSPTWEPKEVRERLQKDYDDEDEDEDEEGGDGDDDDDDGDGDDNPEEEDDYDDEISENEDEELLKRLETKYGKLEQSHEDVEGDEDEDEEEEEEGEGDDRSDFDSWKRATVPPTTNVVEDTDSENEKDWAKQGSGPQALYEFANITNTDDWGIREELDRARQNLANDAAYALILFNKILERHPSSPRALYGKAQSLDILAEQKRSNSLLQEAIASYQQLLGAGTIPDALFQTSAERCIDRMRFRGLYNQAVAIHKLLIDRFPQNPLFANNLAVTYLTSNRIKEARNVLTRTLSKWPNNGFALVHYGFILKAIDNELEKAVHFLKTGIATAETGVIDGRFYFHLGDALARLGRKEEAMDVYSDGVTKKVFLSKYQRSLYNVNRLTGKPWWRKEDLPHTLFFQNLESNWKIIRDEGLKVLHKHGNFRPESENLRDVGDWKQFELYARGVKNVANCKQCPITCKMVETLSDATGCRRGQIKFSVMHPGTHVWPHCGPTNCRLRVHLGLKVPLNTYIRVGEEIRSWENGKLLIFDDSFEHEVWHNGTDTRLVLILDVWHPELTKEEKQSLSSI